MVREGCFAGIEERNALRFPSLRRTGAVGVPSALAKRVKLTENGGRFCI